MSVLKVDEINLTDPAFWAAPMRERHEAFATLRRERPIARFTWGYGSEAGSGVGYYAVTRYRDIVDASRQPALFSSGRGSTSIMDLPPPMLEYFGSIINMDDPRHKRLRDIVSKTFTVRQVRQIEEYVERAADAIVDSMMEARELDFVTDVAARLPLKVICDMMGVPESQYNLVFERSNAILGAGDPEYRTERDDGVAGLVGAANDLTQLMNELAEERKRNPTEDITSALVNANVDGETLTQGELASFFILLVVAGNETTRNAISWGLLALDEHRDQRDLWRSEFERHSRTAVDEIVRWATPVTWMRRTVTQDGARLGEHEFAEGDKVLLYYNSGNRDEAIFTDADRFDLTRDPNPHIGFGGPGPHFCLGASLARQEIKVMFRELFARVPDIQITGEPQRLRSDFINGIKHLPVRV